MGSLTRYDHTLEKREVANNLDPDVGNSTLCGACWLPIFSTPTINDDRNNLTVLHDHCANDLPATLEDYPLHPVALHRRNQQLQDSTHSCRCSRCDKVCGSVFYECPAIQCRYRLDVVCAHVTIKILHRSHYHRLTAVRSRGSSICDVCGAEHQRPKERGLWQPELSYVCHVCDFWVHPDCALLPNAIDIDQHHPHPLLLTYDLDEIMDFDEHGSCGICRDRSKCIGFYVCVDCRYYAHSKCAISLPHKQDEHTIVMRYVRDQTTASGDEKFFTDEKIHEHPLIFDDHHDINYDDDDDHRSTLVCNACVGPISSSDPFYRCSTNNELCRDFFLHRSCAHLPARKRIAWWTYIEFSLISKVDQNAFNIFWCAGCKRQCNGFAYAFNNFYFDVVCASMPELITHEAHGRAHILHLDWGYSEGSHCCGLDRCSYSCTNCHEFTLHFKCALLPDTVTHKFDRHPLKLITDVTGTRDERVICSDQDHLLCEICEEDIDDRYWYYSCGQCDQSFHIDCIPCFDKLSNIKFGFTIRVRCHDCPLACVRARTVDGYRCGHCQRIIREGDELVFECSKCYFRIHKNCAKKL